MRQRLQGARRSADGRQLPPPPGSPGPRRGWSSAASTLPRPLAVAASYAAALLLLAGAGYLAWHVLAMIMLLVVPLAAALLLTALLEPVTRLLRRHGVPSALATWAALLLGAAVLGGLGMLVWLRGSAESGALAAQLSSTVQNLRGTLQSLHLPPDAINQIQQRAVSWLNSNRGRVLSDAFGALRSVFDVLAGFVLMLFITFFLLYDGARIWQWVLALFGREVQPRLDRAGQAMWGTLTGYVHGTVVIAAFHGVVIGTVLWLLGTPLVIPLALLVFLGSFIPIIGAVLFGGIAVLVTLTTGGLTPALILLGVLLIENQVEAHLLQPFVVGRYVKLHPLAIGMTLAAGGAVLGLLGAIVAVPLVASLKAGFIAIRRNSQPGASAIEDPERDARGRHHRVPAE